MSSDGATLIGVRSPIAGSVALVGAEGKRASPMALPLPAGATVALAPGKFRIALGRIARTLRVGDRVPLTLVVRDVSGASQEIDVDAEVRLRSPTDDHCARIRTRRTELRRWNLPCARRAQRASISDERENGEQEQRVRRQHALRVDEKQQRERERRHWPSG